MGIHYPGRSGKKLSQFWGARLGTSAIRPGRYLPPEELILATVPAEAITTDHAVVLIEHEEAVTALHLIQSDDQKPLGA